MKKIIFILALTLTACADPKHVSFESILAKNNTTVQQYCECTVKNHPATSYLPKPAQKGSIYECESNPERYFLNTGRGQVTRSIFYMCTGAVK